MGLLQAGDAQLLVANFPCEHQYHSEHAPPATNIIDLTTTPPSIGTPIIANGGANGMIIGPDGCIYMAEGVAVCKITERPATCN